VAKEKTSLYFLKYSDDFRGFKAGETIFAEGSPGYTMYVVRNGKVDLRHDGTVLETVEPGGIFGEMALIDHSVRSATAVALTDCEIVPVDGDKFQFLIQQTPYFAVEVMRIMSRRLRAANRERSNTRTLRP
jgi:CRP-like cAMP-binding protein